jgi:uncharacterized membrane protein HdeD (DUF308 family)
MSAALARNWWLIGLRALAAGVFILCVALLPLQNIASLVVLFAAYVVADGALAILAGLWAAPRGERWWSLILEGAMNLAVAAILVWPAVVAFPFVNLTAAWAIITGALLFAAAHRLAVRHGRWLVVFGGAVSVAWGLLAATLGPAAGSNARTIAPWLAAYMVIFGATMLILSLRLQRRHDEAVAAANTGQQRS